MNFKITSPSGVWDYSSLLGASVKIKSLPVKFGFAYAADELYQIENIGFRISRDGKLYTAVRLAGIRDREFVWKDLEVVGLRMPIWSSAWCGLFCAGNALCGYTKTNSTCGGGGYSPAPAPKTTRIQRIALDESDYAAISRVFFGKIPQDGEYAIVIGKGGENKYIYDSTYGWTIVDDINQGIRFDEESIIKNDEDVYQVGVIDGGEI